MHRNQSCQGQLCLVRGKATRSALLHKVILMEAGRDGLSPSFRIPLANASLLEANLPPKAM